MKKSSLLLYFFLLTIAQVLCQKNDHTWVLGYPSLIPGQLNTDRHGGMLMGFTEDGIKVETIDIMGGPTSATANDNEGRLLFYTNNCQIYDRNHILMDNGDEINIGAVDYELKCEEYLGIPANVRSGTAIVPMPGHPDLHVLLHLRLVATSDTNPNDLVYDRLQFTTVDMSANGGLGRVTEKNQVVVADSLHDALAVVRHGNGRDWWVVIPRGTDREFWVALLTPEGFQPPVLQKFPPPYPPFTIRYMVDISVPPYYKEYAPDEYGYECYAGQANFSPDGSKYCRAVRSSGVEVFDFDRCSGTLRFRRHFGLPPYTAYPDIPTFACGLAVSPNNRYLYFNNHEALYQFDMCEERLESGGFELVEEWDRFLDEGSLPTNFFQMRNGPDGKIYVNSTVTTHYLHTIHAPDNYAGACDFEQRAVQFPRFSHFVLNYFPNFRLYDLPGSPCDTLGIDDPNPPVPKRSFDALTLYPNPAGNVLNLYMPGCERARLKVWSAAGQLLREVSVVPGGEEYRLDVSWLPAGTYMLAAFMDERAPEVRRFVVTR